MTFRLLPGHQRFGQEVLDVVKFGAENLQINCILAPDGPIFHAHPGVWTWGLILSGGYTHEFYYVKEDGSPDGPPRRESFGPGDVNFMPHTIRHRIDSVLPHTVTLFMQGPGAETADDPELIERHMARFSSWKNPRE